jgi:lipid II:glycine glycyltransferase (peptidoglycan interpeptide bridge formation enzyme)
MLAWDSYNGTADEWNNSLSLAQDKNIFQSYEWGQYKDLPKLITRRYIARNEKGIVCGMCQVSIRKLPLGHHFVWSAGGPIFQFKSTKQDYIVHLLSSLFEKLHEDYPRSLIRIHSHIANSPDLAFKFNKVATKPIFKLNTGFTIKFILKDIPDFRKIMTSKHRYYTKKSSEVNIQWVRGNDNSDINYLIKLHQEMVVSKNISSISMHPNELIRMRNYLKNNLSVLTGFISGEPVTSCLTLDFQGNSFYMIAATGSKGRTESSAYAMIEKLISQLKDNNVANFDFAGVDPITKGANGVNHFKMGFGGNLIEQLGEWESASSEPIRIAINFAIRFKGGRA